MNIVYLLVHRTRMEENNPPYYYIGSKYRWKGEGTYKSSSRSPIVRDSYPEDLILTPLWVSDCCTVKHLLEVERQYQIKHDVLNNHLFFNGNIANSKLFDQSPEVIQKRVEKFKLKANSISPCGKKYSEIWSEKASITKENKYSKEYLSKLGAERQNQPHSSGSGLLVKEVVHEKMMSTMSTVGNDGLTGFQRAGRQLSRVLNSVDESTGMTMAVKRRYFGSPSTRFTLFGICFFSRRSALEMLDISREVLRNLRKGFCSEISYIKLEKILGEDYISQYPLSIKNAGDTTKDMLICGEVFHGQSSAMFAFSATQWAVQEFVRTGKPNKALKLAMIARYGEVKYYDYYPDV